MARPQDAMHASSSSDGAVYVNNGPSKLEELERVELTGAQIVFDGPHDLRDLQRVKLIGAIVFSNGQELFPDPGTVSIETNQWMRTSCPQRRRRTYDPHEDLRRSSRQKRRSEKAIGISGGPNRIINHKEVHHTQNGGRCSYEDENVRELPTSPILHQSSASKMIAGTDEQQSLYNDQGLSSKCTPIANEEYHQSLRQPVVSTLETSGRQEDTKPKKLSPEMQQVEGQLSQYSVEASMPKRVPSRATHGVSQLRLPNQSPLHSMMTFAVVQEDIVQAKVQYSLAEKAIRYDNQVESGASGKTTRRLKQAGELLTGRRLSLMNSNDSICHSLTFRRVPELYEKREATIRGRDRTQAYHNIKHKVCEANGEGSSSREVLRKIELRQVCEENGRVRFGRYQAGSKMILPSSVDQDDTKQLPPCRRVRFALTDIETFVEP